MVRAVLTVAAVLAVTGCEPAGGAGREPPQPCRGSAPSVCPPPYQRAAFGPDWVRVRGSCDTREIILERDAGDAAVDTDGDGCRDDGLIRDVYTGRVIPKGEAHVDHVYSLAGAWRAGAWSWPAQRRRLFAQDQGNLRATHGTVNTAKGDRGPAEWVPPERSGWCAYALVWEATARRWGLPVSAADAAAVTTLRAACPR